MDAAAPLVTEATAIWCDDEPVSRQLVEKGIEAQILPRQCIARDDMAIEPALIALNHTSDHGDHRAAIALTGQSVALDQPGGIGRDRSAHHSAIMLNAAIGDNDCPRGRDKALTGDSANAAACATQQPLDAMASHQPATAPGEPACKIA